jgi:hypothetical protein
MERSGRAVNWPLSGHDRLSSCRRDFVVRGQPRSLTAKQGKQPMTAIRSEMPEATEEDANLAAVSDVEAGIRDFVRKDIAYLRRAPSALNSDATPDVKADADAAVSNVNTLIQRVAGASVSEIESLIAELDSLRNFMHSEGQRVQRELASFAQLSQTAMKSTRMIADNLAQWKRGTPPSESQE